MLIDSARAVQPRNLAFPESGHVLPSCAQNADSWAVSRPGFEFTKRVVDVTIALLVLALLSPLHDALITRVGRILRQAGLDEVPQFLNVLQGEM